MINKNLNFMKIVKNLEHFFSNPTENFFCTTARKCQLSGHSAKKKLALSGRECKKISKIYPGNFFFHFVYELRCFVKFGAPSMIEKNTFQQIFINLYK